MSEPQFKGKRNADAGAAINAPGMHTATQREEPMAPNLRTVIVPDLHSRYAYLSSWLAVAPR
jgi:hypothetical protein